MDVTLDDLYNGEKKDFTFKRNRLCNSCSGTGSSKPDDAETCSKCQGNGIVVGLQQVGMGFVQQVKQYCPDCFGKGKKYKDEFKCKTCLGSAVTLEDKTLKVNIKKGMNHGTQIQFESEGDESPIASAGDIIIILQQKKNMIYF